MDLLLKPTDCSSESVHESPSTPEPDASTLDDQNTSINTAEPKEELESPNEDMPLNDDLIFVDEFDENSAEFSEPIFKQKIVSLDLALRLQREKIFALQQAIDHEGRGLDNRKKLMEEAKKKREALIELRARIMQRIDDEDNERFLNESLVGIELPV